MCSGASDAAGWQATTEVVWLVGWLVGWWCERFSVSVVRYLTCFVRLVHAQQPHTHSTLRLNTDGWRVRKRAREREEEDEDEEINKIKTKIPPGWTSERAGPAPTGLPVSLSRG